MNTVSATVIEPPRTAREWSLARAAALACPTSAIACEDRPASDGPSVPVDESLFDRLFLEAEAVRWRFSDVPWHQLDVEAVTPGLRTLVRAVALSELTTYTATRRFLAEFSDDIELSQWIAVWHYEEGKHPHALMSWLRHVGETVADNDIVRARATTPFMRSRIGTLVSNVISEAVAAARYLTLSRRASEPVLRHIAERLAGDEARHGASFYRFARRALDRSRSPEADRLAALKVLYFWLFESGEVSHPVSLLVEHAHADAALAAELARMAPPDGLRERVARLVGNLIDIELDGPDAVMPALRRLAALSRVEGAATTERP